MAVRVAARQEEGRYVPGTCLPSLYDYCMTVITDDDSPFKVIRKRTGLTQGEFAERCSMAIGTIVYVEAGLYERNPAKPAAVLLQAAEEKSVDVREIVESFGGHTLDEATVQYQKRYRKRNPRLLVPAYRSVFTDNDPSELAGNAISPIDRLAILSFGTRDSFAKQLKVPPVVVRQFHTGHTYKLPQAMRTAFLDSGLLDGQADVVEEAQHAWLAHSEQALALVD